jgi:transposase
VTDLTASETELAEVSDLDEAEAWALGREIANGVQNVYVLVEEAKVGRAWLALGLPDLKSFLVLHVDPDSLKIPAGERKALFKSLTGEGLSHREIATVTGTSRQTIDRTLSSVVKSGPSEPHAQVTGGIAEIDPDVEEVTDPRHQELIDLAANVAASTAEERADRKKDEETAQIHAVARQVVRATMAQVQAFFAGLDRTDPTGGRLSPENVALLVEFRDVIDRVLAKASQPMRRSCAEPGCEDPITTHGRCLTHLRASRA